MTRKQRRKPLNFQGGLFDWRNLIERNGPTGANANAPKVTLKNIVLILTNEAPQDVVKRDLFSFRDFYGYATPWGGEKGKALTDDDMIKIKFWLSSRYRFEPNVNLVSEAMTYIAEKNAMDPVREMLEALPDWDFEPRLDTWLRDYFEAEGPDEYLAQVFRKWIVALIMRVYEPGAKFDWMPIYEGAQGIGKSSFGRLLVGDKFFLDWLPNLGDKDAALGLQGIWLIEMGELANLRRTELETVKAFLTRQVDKVRPPYGRKVLEVPRRSIFFGTTNADSYLQDHSGNRRFKPVKVGQLDFDQLAKDREQLFAEALFLFQNGLEYSQSLELTGEAKIFERQIQKQKTVEDESSIMRDVIEKFIEVEAKKPDAEQFNFKSFKNSDLFSDFGPLGSIRVDTRSLMMAGKALKELGFEKYMAKGCSKWRKTGVDSR